MIIVRAPFRIPIGGGGTDIPSYYSRYSGSLITAAINKYMYVSVNEPVILNKIKIGYSKIEEVDIDSISTIQHDIVRETVKYLNFNRSLEIHSMADIPAGTGMGSSSSYTVALLKAINTLNRRYISLQEIAEEACKVEIDLCKKHIGKQDQYASTFGGINHLNIDKQGRVVVEQLNIKQETIYELENRIMLFYTGINRDTNKIISEQSNKIKNYEFIVTKAMHKIKDIGEQIRTSLIIGDIDSIGELMNEHWITKKTISNNMTTTNIDRWYDIGLNNGAIGGKIMGAGGGGFLLFCVKNGKRKDLRFAMESEGLQYMDFKFDFEGVKVISNI